MTYTIEVNSLNDFAGVVEVMQSEPVQKVLGDKDLSVYWDRIFIDATNQGFTKIQVYKNFGRDVFSQYQCVYPPENKFASTIEYCIHSLKKTLGT